MKDFKKLIIKNLTKKFGALTVLNNFNLTLEKGEFVTFLGPSGCGKSTALNCISGLIPLTGGEIYIDDECIDNSKKKIPPEKREFGMVFQNYALFPHLTVFKNVSFGLELKGLNKNVINEKVKSALSMVHLDGYDGSFPGQLSGGQQQRVAIARCIVMEPRLLLLDEPLSNLDAKLRNDMRSEIKSLHERLKITFIYVTHDHQEALALSDRIVVMNGGFIQQIGTSEEIYSQPANLFVADFMGFRNIWETKIESIKENENNIEFVTTVNESKVVSSIKNNDKNKICIENLKEAFAKNQIVTAAIRPEDILVGKGEFNNLDCVTDIVEYLGQTFHIVAYMNNNKRIDARSTDKVKVGEKLSVWLAPEKVLIFPEKVGEIKNAI